MTQTTVVSLPGVAGCQAPGEADQAILSCLRDLLAEAERGEIVGFLYGIVRPQRSGISTGWEPGSAATADMLAAANGVNARITLAWVQNV